jgi:hypothetical protein
MAGDGGGEEDSINGNSRTYRQSKKAVREKLGGVGSPDARLIRGMIVRLQELHADVKKLRAGNKC